MRPIFSVLTAAILIAACSDTADDSVTMVERTQSVSSETVATPPATPDPADTGEWSRDMFSADLLSGVVLEQDMDSDDAEIVLNNWLMASREAEGNSSTDIKTIYEIDGRTLIIATRDGLLDDSVAAQQIYTEFTPISPLTNALDFAGMRMKCARGRNAGQWTTELCP